MTLKREDGKIFEKISIVMLHGAAIEFLCLAVCVSVIVLDQLVAIRIIDPRCLGKFVYFFAFATVFFVFGSAITAEMAKRRKIQ